MILDEGTKHTESSNIFQGNLYNTKIKIYNCEKDNAWVLLLILLMLSFYYCYQFDSTPK